MFKGEHEVMCTSCSKSVVLKQSYFVHPGALGNIIRAFWLSHQGVVAVSLFSLRWRPGKLLNIVQCIGQLPVTEMYVAPNGNSAEVGTSFYKNRLTSEKRCNEGHVRRGEN